MPGTYGTHLRDKPQIQVLRGWHGNESAALTEVLPPKNGENIQSGQVIIKEFDATSQRWVYVKATKAKVTGSVIPPAFALRDQSRPNVASADGLLGLSCTGSYTIQTAFFDSGTYNPGDMLTVSTTTAGNLAKRQATEHVVGVCKAGKVFYGVDANDPNNARVTGVDMDKWDGYVLEFDTHWQPVLA